MPHNDQSDTARLERIEKALAELTAAVRENTVSIEAMALLLDMALKDDPTTKIEMPPDIAKLLGRDAG